MAQAAALGDRAYRIGEIAAGTGEPRVDYV
jgi:hypothetical protein